MDSIDQFFDFIKRGEHTLVNLNPHFVLVPEYTGIVSLFVHTVYRSDDFYTHTLLQDRRVPLSAHSQREDLLCNPDKRLRSTSSFCVHRGQIAHQKIPDRHQNDRHSHGTLVGALR